MSNSGPRHTRLRNARQGLGLRSQRADADGGLPPMMNRRAFVSRASALSAVGLTQFTACGLEPARPAVTYAFADDFDGPAGSAPDPSKWRYDLGGGGWGNNELQVYTSSRANSFLDGKGHLVIRATKSVQTSGGRTATTYHSARLNTLGKFSKYHGTFEARIKLDAQPGLWPAWWAIGANFPKVGWPACGEVDMLENYGGPPLCRRRSILRMTPALTCSRRTQRSPWMMGGTPGACGGTREPVGSRSTRMA